MMILCCDVIQTLQGKTLVTAESLPVAVSALP
jgi:hypothetical protein